MDRELEEQIDDLINKATKDLKSKILRIFIRTQNKLLKDQARDFKGGCGQTRKPLATSTKKSHSTKELPTKKSYVSKKDKGSDSDSDEYYSN
jgi:hypothetical protein